LAGEQITTDVGLLGAGQPPPPLPTVNVDVAELIVVLPFLPNTVSLWLPFASTSESETVLPLPAYFFSPSTHASIFLMDEPLTAWTFTGLLPVAPLCGVQRIVL